MPRISSVSAYAENYQILKEELTSNSNFDSFKKAKKTLKQAFKALYNAEPDLDYDKLTAEMKEKYDEKVSRKMIEWMKKEIKVDKTSGCDISSLKENFYTAAKTLDELAKIIKGNDQYISYSENHKKYKAGILEYMKDENLTCSAAKLMLAQQNPSLADRTLNKMDYWNKKASKV